ncbi:MAG: toprim domain-containing protein [Gammaproteobacteria bacterium]|nr:toprim domain-containing protein [Gammaproteobacteria bacterium]
MAFVEMDPAKADQITARLVGEFGFKHDARGWLQRGRCPSCGKNELYTRASAPFVIRCNRINHCSYEQKTRELYPDLYESFNKRYKPTPADPNATADAYMRHARGFDTDKIKGWYKQGKFWHPDGDKGTATVRFYLDDNAADPVYMERFVDAVTITDPETGEKETRKAHFKGSHGGQWWQPPSLDIVEGDTVWIVEGCIDAIALNLSGVKAVSILACRNYPERALAGYAGKSINWIMALDNDAAGRKFARKHVKRMRDAGFVVSAAQAPGKDKTDWNDLYKAGKLTPADLGEYLYHGDLLIAESATQKALLIYRHNGRREFYFNYNKRVFWFALDLEKYDKAYKELESDKALDKDDIREQAINKAGTITPLANCLFTFLYYQYAPLTDESWYYCRVDFPHGAKSIKNTFTGSQLSSPSEFKKRLISIAAGSIFSGSPMQLDRILHDQLYGIKTVETIDYIGYCPDHGVYVYPDISVKDGERCALNDEDFFEYNDLAIKSLSRSADLHIANNPRDYHAEWINDLWRAFGAQGIIAAAFWLGSFFAEQIRATHKSYPFIEIVGEPGAGKTTIIEFLWKCCGRLGYEGFDPSKSTPAARARNFAQVSNLPVVLIESERGADGKNRGFDWDELKTLYNGRSVRARGVKNSGNETIEPPFRGAIVISQNAEVEASQAILERIVHLRFTKAKQSERTREIAEAISTIPVERVSYFLLDAITREREILEVIKQRTPEYRARLHKLAGLNNVRIVLNHAQLCALVDALALVLPIDKQVITEVKRELADMALARQQAINADHPLVVQFWETFYFLNGDTHEPRLDHSKTPTSIAVNLNHFVKLASEQRQHIPDIVELKRLLKASKSHKYVGQRAVNSALLRNHEGTPKTVKCWIFENPEAAQ